MQDQSFWSRQSDDASGEEHVNNTQDITRTFRAGCPYYRKKPKRWRLIEETVGRIGRWVQYHDNKHHQQQQSATDNDYDDDAIVRWRSCMTSCWVNLPNQTPDEEWQQIGEYKGIGDTLTTKRRVLDVRRCAERNAGCRRSAQRRPSSGPVEPARLDVDHASPARSSTGINYRRRDEVSPWRPAYRGMIHNYNKTCNKTYNKT